MRIQKRECRRYLLGRTSAARRTRTSRTQAAIIVQAEAYSAKLPTVLLIPLTSQMNVLRFPGTVLVEADVKNGLRRASVALVFQLTAVDRVGEIAETVLQQIWTSLDELTNRN